MRLTEQISKLRASLSFKLTGFIIDTEPLSITDIPEEWGPFFDTDCTWIRLNYPPSEDMSGCLFKTKAGFYFGKHHHESSEMMTIINPGGSMRCHTPDKDVIINFPNSIYLEPEEWHSVEFLTDTELSILWRPAFKGNKWEAEFENNEKELV